MGNIPAAYRHLAGLAVACAVVFGSTRSEAQQAIHLSRGTTGAAKAPWQAPNSQPASATGRTGGFWSGLAGSRTDRSARITPVDNPFGRPTAPAKPSALESFTDGVKKGFSDFTNAFSPKPKPAADPTALSNPRRPSGETYLAVARMQEEAGNLAEADHQYRRAMQTDPDNLQVLLGCARWNDRQGHTEAAFNLFKLAAEKYPREPSVYNDMALSLARKGRSDEAINAMQKAVELQPRKPLYRNNMATILVDAGRSEAALPHLAAVHGPAVAHYNLGYLLQKKGRSNEAIRHFSSAAQIDPSMQQAQAWLEYLGAPDVQLAQKDRSTNNSAYAEHGAGRRIADRRTVAGSRIDSPVNRERSPLESPSGRWGSSSQPAPPRAAGNSNAPRIRDLPAPPAMNRDPSADQGSSSPTMPPNHRRLQQPFPPEVTVPPPSGASRPAPLPGRSYLTPPLPSHGFSGGRTPALVAPRNPANGNGPPRAHNPSGVTHLPPVVPMPDATP